MQLKAEMLNPVMDDITYPVLNRARRILWLVTGREKIGVLWPLAQG
jgi:6-phosphogluconolactonase/glucosamine-6-phosphate isomerase/deaminase